MEQMDSRPFEVAPGEKARGWLAVAREPGGSTVGIPWMVVRGRQDGPVLTVCSAVHGDEYEGGEAIRRIWNELDPARLRGTLVGVPVLNVPAYEDANRVSPLDGVNMNRIFPGKGTPTISGMIARRFFEEVVEKSDGVLDLHSGGNPLSILPLVAFPRGDDEAHQKTFLLARQTGLEVLWEQPNAWSGALSGASTRAGVPGVTVEIGNDGRLSEPLVDRCREVVTSVMAGWGMIEGDPGAPEHQQVVRGNFTPSRVGGLFQATVTLGQEVEQDQLVGTVRDVFGDVLEEIRAPHAGIVCSYRTVPTVPPGDQTVFVGQVVETLEPGA